MWIDREFQAADVASAASIATALAIAFGLLFAAGYFSVFGFRFVRFLTLSDMLPVALVGFLTLGGVVLGTFLNLWNLFEDINQRLLRAVHLRGAQRRQARMSRWRWVSIAAIALVAIIFLALPVQHGAYIGALVFLGLSLVSPVFIPYSDPSHAAIVLRRWLKLTLVATFIVGSYWIGRGYAASDVVSGLRSDVPLCVGQRCMCGTVLLKNEKGLLVFERSRMAARFMSPDGLSLMAGEKVAIRKTMLAAFGILDADRLSQVVEANSGYWLDVLTVSFLGRCVPDMSVKQVVG